MGLIFHSNIPSSPGDRIFITQIKPEPKNAWKEEEWRKPPEHVMYLWKRTFWFEANDF